MTRPVPKARKRIDWEANRQRLQQVVVSPEAARAEATRILAERAARLAQARTALGEDGFQREWELGSTLPAASVRSKVDALAAQPATPGR